MDFKLAAKYDWPFILFLLVGTTPTFCKGHINHDSLKYSSEAQRIIHSNQARHCVDDACSSINGEKDVFQETNISKEFSGQDISSSRIYAIWSTLIISAAPFFLLYYIPLDNSEAMRPRLNVILAFASGSLLGDAFLHLIPHASHVHKDNHHSHETNTDASNLDQMSIGLGVLSGIITFLGVEKLVRLVKCHHSHSHCKEILKKTLSKGGVKSNKNTQKSHNGKNVGDVDISAYLNLVADFAHNFTDGLSIGASYLAGKSIGILTTVTILLHEIPHEIGDFAILVKSGCSKRKAIWLQLLTALGSIAGTALAFHGAGDDGNISIWVLPFTAGGFIYIATVSVLPEILEDSTKLTQSIKEISALLCGVSLMVFIANME